MESAEDTLFRRLLLLMAARSGDHEKLVLGQHEDAAAAMAGWLRDIVIDLAATAASVGDTYLHCAAAGGDGDYYLKSATARIACNKERGLLVACNGEGDTPLHLAARAGNTHMVNCLIDLALGNGEDDGELAKAMVRARNQRGETALHDAIRSGETDMVHDLI